MTQNGPVTSNHVGKALLEALGLSHMRVCDLHIHFPNNGVVTIDVTYYPDEFHVRNAITVLREFKLGAIT